MKILHLGVAVLLLAGLCPAARAEGDAALKRERIEWCDIWFTDADKDALPRVLLVGDSITRGYFDGVEKALAGKAQCGRLCTSRSVCDPVFFKELSLVLEQYKYSVIHFNNGLHGWDYDEAQYKDGFAKFVAALQQGAPGAKLICATTTPVQEKGGMKDHATRVPQRNRIAGEICAAAGIPLDDLHALVDGKPDLFSGDGVHFNDAGRAAEVTQVAASIAGALTAPISMVVAPAQGQFVRNSEAAIVPLKDGSLLLGWTEFYAGNGAAHGPARLVGLVSHDAGRTWAEKHTLVENDGKCNVMEVNFLRLKSGEIALLYCQKNSEEGDCRVMLRRSTDEGKTFGEALQISAAGKYTGLTNGRGVRLASGRLLIEAYENGDSYCYLSDDDGAHWREGARVKPANGECWEPACIELKDGRVMMLLRTGLGGQYKCYSSDGGETWTAPVPSPLEGSAAPVSISRVPKTGDLLAVWNHNPGGHARTPFTAAISQDEGETWTHIRNIEEKPGDQWAYPAVTWVGNEGLLTYFNYDGGLSLLLKILPVDWLYE